MRRQARFPGPPSPPRAPREGALSRYTRYKACPIRVCAPLASRYSLATDRVSDPLQARRSEGSRPRHRDGDNAAGGQRHVGTGDRLALLQAA